MAGLFLSVQVQAACKPRGNGASWLNSFAISPEAAEKLKSIAPMICGYSAGRGFSVRRWGRKPQILRPRPRRRGARRRGSLSCTGVAFDAGSVPCAGFLSVQVQAVCKPRISASLNDRRSRLPVRAPHFPAEDAEKFEDH